MIQRSVQEAEQNVVSIPVTDLERRRFWKKVDVGLSDECWYWKHSCWRNGYGQVRLRGTMLGAHRVAFFLYNGYWARPMCLHKPTCKRNCCNPLHLRAGNHQENLNDPWSPHKYTS